MVGNHLYLYLLLGSCGTAAMLYGGEPYLLDHLKINLHDYKKIKKAIFEKKGSDFKQRFKNLYPEPCADSVLYLAESFDADSCTEWYVEGQIQVTKACINGKDFKIVGVIAEIVQLVIKTPPYFYWGY